MFNKVGPCHHDVVCPQVVDGEDSLHIWKADVNIMNKAGADS
jgi:hypothetical protein